METRWTKIGAVVDLVSKTIMREVNKSPNRGRFSNHPTRFYINVN